MKRAATSLNLQDLLSTNGKGRSLSKFQKNERIFSQGDEASSVFYIVDGDVKLSVISEQGRDAVVGILSKDEFFGEACLVGKGTRISTATSIGESEILEISRSAFVAALKKLPALPDFFISHVVKRSIRIEADLVDQLFNSSEKRLARALLLLAKFGREGRPEPIVAKISQETLASMIGTTRARVSFFMNKFRRLGFVSYNGKVEVHSSLLSVVLADQPAVHKQVGKGGK